MSTQKLHSILSGLAELGIEDWCVCAGSRNSPLVAHLLEASGPRLFHFFEERSAGFFALGLSKASSRPVAVVTTSGTAAAELLPAAIEAHYSGIPLVLITADRPKNFRGSGAPQSIEQKDLYGAYISANFDLDEADPLPDFGSWNFQAPLHLNLCFGEPLLEARAESLDLKREAKKDFQSFRADLSMARSDLEAFFKKSKRPLILVSSLQKEARAEVKEFILRAGHPVYLEASSNLRNEPELQPLVLKSGERILSRGGFDGVLRLGGVPHLRFWRDLEERFKDLPVLSLDTRSFTGLSQGRSTLIQAAPQDLLRGFSPAVGQGAGDPLRIQDEALYQKKLELFSQEPGSEPALVHSLSRLIPEASRVFLGNSLPVREWDLAATFKAKKFEIDASRGANGIDGQLSSFLGFAAPDESEASAPEAWGIFGDLTTLYDLSGPWILSQLEELSCRFVVINNGGGRIFSRLKYLRDFVPEPSRRKVFENSHDLDFSHWARLWNLGYERWQRVPAFLPGASQGVVEIVPDPDSTDRFWLSYEELWKSVK